MDKPISYNVNLFPNERKEKDTHPDMKGSAKFGKVWMWASAWKKQGKNGEYLSLSLQPMTPEHAEKTEQKQQQYEANKGGAIASDVPDSGLPF